MRQKPIISHHLSEQVPSIERLGSFIRIPFITAPYLRRELREYKNEDLRDRAIRLGLRSAQGRAHILAKITSFTSFFFF